MNPLSQIFPSYKTLIMISENQFTDSAKILNVEAAAIRAVAEVESSGDGMLADG